ELKYWRCRAADAQLQIHLHRQPHGSRVNGGHDPDLTGGEQFIDTLRNKCAMYPHLRCKGGELRTTVELQGSDQVFIKIVHGLRMPEVAIPCPTETLI